LINNKATIALKNGLIYEIEGKSYPSGSACSLSLTSLLGKSIVQFTNKKDSSCILKIKKK